MFRNVFGPGMTFIGAYLSFQGLKFVFSLTSYTNSGISAVWVGALVVMTVVFCGLTWSFLDEVKRVFQS